MGCWDPKNLKPEPEICPPRSGGWRVSRRRGRVFSYWRVSRRRGRVFSYLAAYMLGLVLGLVCRSSISFLAFQDILAQPPLQGASLFFIKYPERILSLPGCFLCFFVFVFVFVCTIRSAKLYQTVSIPGNRYTIQRNKKVILGV